MREKKIAEFETWYSENKHNDLIKSLEGAYVQDGNELKRSHLVFEELGKQLGRPIETRDIVQALSKRNLYFPEEIQLHAEWLDEQRKRFPVLTVENVNLLPKVRVCQYWELRHEREDVRDYDYEAALVSYHYKLDAEQLTMDVFNNLVRQLKHFN